MDLDNIDLVEPMLSGIINWLTDHTNSGLSNIIQIFKTSVNIRSMEFYRIIGVITSDQAQEIETTSPFSSITLAVSAYNADIFKSFYYIGFVLLVAITIFSFLSMAGGPITESKEEFVQLIPKFFFTLVILIFIRSILDIVNYCLSTLLSTSLQEGELNIDIQAAIASAAAYPLNGILTNLITFILEIAIIIEFIKIVLSLVERYSLTHFLIMLSPVAVSTYVSITTSSICINFIRMYVCNLIVFIVNNLAINLFFMMLCNSGASTIFGCLIIIGFLRTVQKLDMHLRNLGLSVAQTGGALLGSIGVAAMGLGMAARSMRGGIGTVGSYMAMAGQRAGNFQMAKAGQQLASFGHRQGPVADSVAIKNFAQGSGFANTDANDMLAMSHGLSAFNQGQYDALSSMGQNQDLMTNLVKGAFTANGEDLFQKATGFSADSIKQASIDNRGNISGVLGYTTPEGGQKELQFSSVPLSNYNPMRSNRTKANLASIDGLGDGKQRDFVVSRDPQNMVSNGTVFNDDFAKMPQGQASTGSVVTGTPVDNNLYKDLNVASQQVLDGNLVAYDGSGNMVAAVNMETGKSFHTGTNNNIDIQDAADGGQFHMQMPTEQQIFDQNGPYVSSMPDGAVAVKDSYKVSQDGKSVYCEWQAGSTVGKLYISQPKLSDISKESNTRIINAGNQQGCYTVKSMYKSQSNQSVKDYHKK